MKAKHKIELFYHLIRGVISPGNVNHAVRAGTTLCKSGILQISIDKITSTDDGKKFFESKDLVVPKDPQFYQQFPEGSFGKEYYNFLTTHNLDPRIFPETKVSDDATYLEHVVRQTHDLWHVVTGFDVSVQGEIGMQAFMAKQLNWPFAMLALAAGCILTLLNEPKKIGQLMSDINRGYILAEQINPLITVDWNQYWTTELSEVQKRLGATS